MRDMRDMRIVITGPPAAGKTTVRAQVVPWLAEQGCTVEEVSVDAAIRRLYPPQESSPDYIWKPDGAIELFRPLQQIPPAVYLAIDECRAAAARGGFIFELASNECVQLLDRGRDLLSGALVIALAAPVELRSARNAERGETLIPDDRLRVYPDRMPDKWARGFEAAGASVEGFDASQSLDVVVRAVRDTLAARLDASDAGLSDPQPRPE